MGTKVPHRHQQSTWLSRGKCKKPNRHEEQARRLGDAILLGDEYAAAAGLIPELIHPSLPLGWWRAMDCGCYFAAVPVLVQEEHCQGVEERTIWRAYHAHFFESEESGVLPLDGAVINSAHNAAGSSSEGPTEQRRSA